MIEKKEEEIWYRSKATRTSQTGRLYAYLNSFSSSEKRRLIEEALSGYYLVEALKAEGVRSREDIKNIAYKKAEYLMAQARSVLYMAGIEPQSISLGGRMQLTSGDAHISNTAVRTEEQSADNPVSVAESNADEEKKKPIKLKEMKRAEDIQYSEEEEKEISEGISNFLNEL